MNNLTSNFTSWLQVDRNISWVLTPLCVFIVLVCLVGLVGNTITIFLLCFRIKINQSSTYILNLAIADCLFQFGSCIFFLFYLCIINGVETSLVTFRGFTRFANFVNPLAFAASLFFLSTLSAERSLSVCFPIWYKCRRPEHLSAALSSVIWAVSLLLGALECFLYRKYRPNVFIATSVIFFTLTIVMIVSSVVLLIQIQKASKQCRPIKLYVVVFFAILNFLISLVPTRILEIIIIVSVTDKGTTLIFNKVIYICAAINSALNPYIYIIVGRWKKSLSTAKALEAAFKEDFDGTPEQTNISSGIHKSESTMKLEDSIELCDGDDTTSSGSKLN